LGLLGTKISGDEQMTTLCEWLWWPQALFILAFCSKKVAPGGPKCGPMWGLSFWILGLKIKHEGLVFGAVGWAQKWGPIWSQIPSSKLQNIFSLRPNVRARPCWHYG